MRLARDSVILLHSHGISQAEIARRAGVSRQRINQVVEASKRDDLHKRYRQLLEVFGLNREGFGRQRQRFLLSVEDFNRARAMRLKYLKAHPRARREQPAEAINGATNGHQPVARLLSITEAHETAAAADHLRYGPNGHRPLLTAKPAGTRVSIRLVLSGSGWQRSFLL